jgi:hypothetical protein
MSSLSRLEFVKQLAIFADDPLKAAKECEHKEEFPLKPLHLFVIAAVSYLLCHNHKKLLMGAFVVESVILFSLWTKHRIDAELKGVKRLTDLLEFLKNGLDNEWQLKTQSIYLMVQGTAVLNEEALVDRIKAAALIYDGENETVDWRKEVGRQPRPHTLDPESYQSLKDSAEKICNFIICEKEWKAWRSTLMKNLQTCARLFLAKGSKDGTYFRCYTNPSGTDVKMYSVMHGRAYIRNIEYWWNEDLERLCKELQPAAGLSSSEGVVES